MDGAVTVVSAAVPAAANNQPNLAFGIILTGGQSNGDNLQNVVDNILINGTIVPEPATIAGGLLGVLGLCWFQRRRLIRRAAFAAHVTDSYCSEHRFRLAGGCLPARRHAEAFAGSAARQVMQTMQ